MCFCCTLHGSHVKAAKTGIIRAVCLSLKLPTNHQSMNNSQHRKSNCLSVCVRLSGLNRLHLCFTPNVLNIIMCIHVHHSGFTQRWWLCREIWCSGVLCDESCDPETQSRVMHLSATDGFFIQKHSQRSFWTLFFCIKTSKTELQFVSTCS